MKTVSIGCGSAWAEDWLEPGVALANSGLVKYMGFDCLAERTLALAQIRRLKDDSTGHDERIAHVAEEFAPSMREGVTIVGNFGAANPGTGAAAVVDGLRKAGLEGCRVGVIWGDDVRGQVLDLDLELPEMGATARQVESKMVSAHAYIGAQPIVDLLQQDTRFILGGRIADPSLFVGPICHELGWSVDDFDRVGVATVAGHLLECGIHATGGNYVDPPMRVLPDLHDLGAPMATISEEGEIIVTKLPGTGGGVNLGTMRTQLAYEIHDPSAYLTPDVSADFTGVTLEEVGPDRVRVLGGKGSQRPDKLKVLVGLDLGWKVVGEVSYGGPACLERAKLGEELFLKRVERFLPELDEIRCDMVGVSSLFGDQMSSGYPSEVRLRIAARYNTREAANGFLQQVEYLLFGPAGAGGATKSIVPAIGVTPAYIDRDKVPVETEVIVV